LSSLRREPTQDRSKQRVERIVDAATHVFAEGGYEGATTEAIAERAGVPIGSLYQFFPNKKALFEAVGNRHLEAIRTLFDSFFTKERFQQPWHRVLDDAVEGFWIFHRTAPGFQAVWKSFVLNPEFLVAGDALNREIAERLEDILAHYTSLPKKRREIIATVLVETLSAMLLVGARMNEPRASSLLAETKVLLRRYLEPYADRTK
jgi:AcrR family transcriptional regulator